MESDGIAPPHIEAREVEPVERASQIYVNRHGIARDLPMQLAGKMLHVGRRDTHRSVQ